MENAILLIVLLLIFGPIALRLILWLVSLGESATSAPTLPVPVRPLEVRLREVQPTDEHPHLHYEVECRGVVTVLQGRSLLVESRVLDVTSGEPEAVLSLLDWQQDADSPIYLDQTPMGEWSAPIFGADEWTPLQLKIWPEALRAPYSGQRHLQVLVRLRDAHDENIAFFYEELDLHLNLTEIGWREFPERRMADEVSAIRLAMAVAAATHGLHETELGIIRDWATEQIAVLDDEEKEARKAELNRVIKTAAVEAQSDTLDLGAEIEAIRSSGTPGGRLEAIELCLKIAHADGRVDSAEIERVNRIAKQLEVDPEWFTEARDKVLGRVGLPDEASGYAAILGIDPGAPKEEIRRELSAQYSKWSARAESLQDAERRAEAERMLEVVAQAREALL